MKIKNSACGLASNKPSSCSRVKTKISKIFLLLSVIVFGFSFNATGKAAEPVNAGAIIEAVNELRVRTGLSPLTSDNRLQAAAQEKINDIREHEYFSHSSPEGIEAWDFIREQGYAFRAAGENLAVNFTDIDALIKAWTNSPSHKQNLLQAGYKDTGVAVQTMQLNGRSYIVIVQLFGDPPLLAQH